LITVREAYESDYAAIGRIQSACPAAAQWPVGDYSNYSVLIAISDAAVVGFCAWRQLAESEAELLNLAVAPSARRRGVASALLTALMEAARGEIFLEAAETNTSAIGLYAKLGWERISIRKAYYENGSVNAVVMKKRSW